MRISNKVLDKLYSYYKLGIMGHKIVLAMDRTMASEYHGSMFYGFSACLPQGTMPDWLYYPVFCPSEKPNPDGSLMFANCGTRKVESALLENGFKRNDVILAHPDYINKLVTGETKILAISSNDPLGIGPATSTFVTLLGGEGRMAVKLRELLNSRAVKKHKPIIFLGGPGAWQLKANPEKQKELGIDCVVVGDGEITAPDIFRKALNNEYIPETMDGITLDNDRFYEIKGPTITGLIEATRGCPRSCDFCVPSLKKIRSTPVSVLKNEVKVNLAAGQGGVILHGEDILLYNSDGLKVNDDAVVNLFTEIYNIPGVKWVSASHASFSSAVSSPQTVEKLSKALELGTELHPTKSFQVGIETGSPELIRKHMKGKVYPYKPEEWPDVVREGFKIFTDNHIIPCTTIILGLPGETDQDVQQTINLIKSIRPYKSIVVPLIFTAMQTTKLEQERSILKDQLTPLHWELMLTSWEHNFDWFGRVYKTYGRENHPLLKTAIKLIINTGRLIVLSRLRKRIREAGG